MFSDGASLLTAKRNRMSALDMLISIYVFTQKFEMNNNFEISLRIDGNKKNLIQHRNLIQHHP